MAPSAVHEAYSADSFTALDEHASQTPATFFSLTPVLHLHCPQTVLRLAKEVYTAHPVFSALVAVDELSSEVEIDDVDVWVTSKFLGIYQRRSSCGLQIDYPSIIVHGQQGDSIMLELSMAQDDQDDIDNDSDDLVQINLLPTSVLPEPAPTEQVNGHASDSHVSAKALYTAIEACQELNPSPMDDEDGDTDMPSFPGAGGWITSDNAHDLLDEEGQFKPPAEWSGEALGPGAGHTRTAPDDEDATDTKWQRTD